MSVLSAMSLAIPLIAGGPIIATSDIAMELHMKVVENTTEVKREIITDIKKQNGKPADSATLIPQRFSANNNSFLSL